MRNENVECKGWWADHHEKTVHRSVKGVRSHKRINDQELQATSMQIDGKSIHSTIYNSASNNNYSCQVVVNITAQNVTIKNNKWNDALIHLLYSTLCPWIFYHNFIPFFNWFRHISNWIRQRGCRNYTLRQPRWRNQLEI